MTAQSNSKNSTKTSKMHRWSVWLTRLFGSNGFFYGVVIFLGLSAAFIALTSEYPMAFDEEVHVGLTQAYAEVLNPFSIVQEPAYDRFSAVTTDPSWLFHYLMSFPYRLLDGLGTGETGIIIVLRLINVALFVVAFWLFRKVLLAAGLSRAGAHVVLAIFTLIPVVPLLAAHVNYDNLLLLVAAGLFWYAIKFRNGLREKRRVPVVPAAAVVALALYGSVVKYAYLPIALGVVAYLFYELWVTWRRDGKKLLARFLEDTAALSRVVKTTLFVMVFLGVFLFAQRFILNTIQYGSPVPKCDQVLSEERCMAFGPYARNVRYMQEKPLDFQPKSFPVFVVTDWSAGMMQRLYFALAGPNLSYETRKPLPVPIKVMSVLIVGGLVLLVVFGRSVLKQYPLFWLFIVPSVLYIGALMVELYGAYVTNGKPVALNGRYLLPLLPGLGAVAAIVYAKLFEKLRAASYQPLFAAVVLLLLLQGGGPLTYIVRSRDAWFWPNTPAPAVAEQVRNAVKPIIYGD